MNGFVQGAEALRSIVTYIRTLYDSQEFNFAGPYGKDGFLEDYNASLRGERSAPRRSQPATTPHRSGSQRSAVAAHRPQPRRDRSKIHSYAPRTRQVSTTWATS